MSVTSHLTKHLLDLLEERRIVVWYDREDAFRDFAAAFRAPACRVVMATDSTLRPRRVRLRKDERVGRPRRGSGEPAPLCGACARRDAGGETA